MTDFISRSDLACDFKDIEAFSQNHIYEKKMINEIQIEKIVLQQDDEKYHKKKGCYIALTFSGLEQEEVRKHLIDALHQQINDMLAYLQLTHPRKVLVCGLGNALLSCDSLGPLLQDQLIVTAHLEDPAFSDQVKTALLIPRVKSQTGIETFELIKGTIDRFHPDLVIAVDALATSNLEKLNHVIQLSSAGIDPGSGVGNHNHALSTENLGVPLISMGVPTVVDCISIAYDLLRLIEDYFASQIKRPHEKLKIVSRNVQYEQLNEQQRGILLGEMGKLSAAERRYLLEEVIAPTDMNMIVMDKNTDISVQELAKIIAHALNDTFLMG